jgi:ferredoxin
VAARAASSMPRPCCPVLAQMPGGPGGDGMVNRHERIVVNPIECDGHGICAELLPERIRLDPWGYPIIDGEEIPLQLREHAQRAVHSCPRLALHLVESRQSAGEVVRKGRTAKGRTS